MVLVLVTINLNNKDMAHKDMALNMSNMSFFCTQHNVNKKNVTRRSTNNKNKTNKTKWIHLSSNLYSVVLLRCLCHVDLMMLGKVLLTLYYSYSLFLFYTLSIQQTKKTSSVRDVPDNQEVFTQIGTDRAIIGIIYLFVIYLYIKMFL